jgi:hypothetical protein
MRSVLLALLLASATARAQPFSSDRPGFANTPEAIPVGAVQVEAGATALASERYRLPDALLRAGLTGASELRVLAPSVADGGGLTDAEVGFKAELPSRSRVRTALLAAVSFDVQDPRATGIGAALAASAPLSTTPWSLAVQGGATSSHASNVMLTGAVSIGRPLDEQVSTYVEAFLADGTDDEAGLALQHGYALLIAPTMQLDASVALGLLGAPDWQVSIGWTGRF